MQAVAKRVSYVGSVEHKQSPSPAGDPRPRADASLCDVKLSEQFSRMNRWLRSAITSGAIGNPWEGNFPRYAWHREGNTVYEARLTNRATGEYKG